MLLTFIVSLVVAFVVLYYFKSKAAIADGYNCAMIMLKTNSAEQVLGYMKHYSSYSHSVNYTYLYKFGVKKALKEYWHD